jgi:hypothetical protein
MHFLNFLNTGPTKKFIRDKMCAQVQLAYKQNMRHGFIRKSFEKKRKVQFFSYNYWNRQ